MLPKSALQSMSVMIATPCYGNNATANFVGPLATLCATLAETGLKAQFETISDSLVTRSRNRLVARFLSLPDLTHLFFIDGDVGFDPTAFYRVLLADRDVAAGVYPIKQMNWPAEGLPAGMTKAEFEARYFQYPFNPLPGGVPVDKDDFGEVFEAPTGFMCIKRQVFSKLAAAYPDLEYRQDSPFPNEKPGTHWLFFDCLREPENKRHLSEDYAFCHLWRNIGGKVYIDLNSKLSHQGPYVWQGDLKAHLRATHTAEKASALTKSRA